MAITMAVGDRLETRLLLEGKVTINGFEVEMVNPGPAPAPIFPLMVTTRPYDIGELTITNYIIAKDNGVELMGLPVVPNLFYPLTGVTVNKTAGINTPRDLEGKKLGVPLGFASNPAVWLRGILAQQFGVDATSITWVEGPRDSLKDVPYPRPPKFDRQQGEDLLQMLETGEIDGLVEAGGESKESDTLAPLVPDAHGLLRDYLQETGTFPINTVLVMKPECHDANPGLADAVIAACYNARTAYNRDEPDDSLHQGIHVGTARSLGLFPRSHGLATHATSIKTLIGYLFEQELISRPYSVEELFFTD